MSSRSSFPALALRGLLGAALAVALVEGGLRLYFQEHEANRVYWGRDAFIAADGLPYRNPSHATLTLGREGSFRHEIRTNALGFRDLREPPDTAREHRMLVAGASFAMGMGVPDPRDLFHVRLEQALRRRPDWPRDLEIYNVSQTGFNATALAALLRQNVERYAPEAVFLLVSPIAFKAQLTANVEIVHGVRMSPERFGAGTLVDWLRARSYLVMRARNPLAGGLAFHQKRILRTVATESVDPEVTRRQLDAFAQLREELAAQGTAVYFIPVGGAFQASDSLRRLGFPVLAVPPRPEWTVPGDTHMNALGHRELATAVAGLLPSYRLAKRLDP